MGLKQSKGPGIITQEQHSDSTRAKVVTEATLAQGIVIPPASDISAASVQFEGTLVRFEASADTYVAFSIAPIGAVSITTSPAIKLEVGIHLLRVPEGFTFIRASLNAVRLEVRDF